MPYKEKDWKDLVIGLQTVAELLQQAKADETKKAFYLSLAVLSIWTFGEYAINVVLELSGQGPEQNHRQADRALLLAAEGPLKRDYSASLSQLEQYRLKASHRSYARGRSVHYSSREIRSCLDEMVQLQAEVEALLRDRGKLS